jgi:cold shock CspA family protein
MYEREGWKTDIAILWEEYRGVILGYKDEELTEEKYLGLPEDWGNFDWRGTKSKEQAYSDISKFKDKLRIHGGKWANKGWTDQDMARHLIQSLKLVDSAKEYEESGSFSTAEEKYKKAGLRVDSLWCRAMDCIGKGETDAAEEALRSALREVKKSPGLHRGRHHREIALLINDLISESISGNHQEVGELKNSIGVLETKRKNALKVKIFYKEKNFGFISQKGKKEDVFFHRNVVRGRIPDAGELVTFESIEKKEDKIYAKGVRVFNEATLEDHRNRLVKVNEIIEEKKQKLINIEKVNESDDTADPSISANTEDTRRFSSMKCRT